MYCNKCGKELPDNAAFCPNCGQQMRPAGNDISPRFPYIKRRNIALCVVFSIITCGIYGLYWLYQIANDINTASSTEDTSGGMVVLFSLITCGIYSIYWAYKCGAKVEKASGQYGSSNSIVYLLLALFGFSIIVWCLVQNEINHHANEQL